MISKKEFAKIASSLLNCLSFTFDAPEFNDQWRMPVLDTEMRLGEVSTVTGIPTEILMEEDVLREKVDKPSRVIIFNFY